MAREGPFANLLRPGSPPAAARHFRAGTSPPAPFHVNRLTRLWTICTISACMTLPGLAADPAGSASAPGLDVRVTMPP